MEAYKTSHLEKQREKAKKPSFDLFKKSIENLQDCSSESHVADSIYSHYGESAKQQVWKDDMENDVWKVVLIYHGTSVVTSNWICEIKLLADIHSCLKLSENPVFDNMSEHIERRYRYVKNMVSMFCQINRLPMC